MSDISCLGRDAAIRYAQLKAEGKLKANPITLRHRRTGPEAANKAVPGELTIGSKTWPTIERGDGFTFVRQGTYTVTMDYKNTPRTAKNGTKTYIKCLRFDHGGIRTHLIHDALRNSHRTLAGCIAPGLTGDADSIKDSAKAMAEIWEALGGFVEGKSFQITVENNITGDEKGVDWMARRKAAGKY